MSEPDVSYTAYNHHDPTWPFCSGGHFAIPSFGLGEHVQFHLLIFEWHQNSSLTRACSLSVHILTAPWYHRALSAVLVHATSLFAGILNNRLLNNLSVRLWIHPLASSSQNMVASRGLSISPNRMPNFRLPQQPIWKSETPTAVWRWVEHADRRFLVPRTATSTQPFCLSWP